MGLHLPEVHLVGHLATLVLIIEVPMMSSTVVTTAQEHGVRVVLLPKDQHQHEVHHKLERLLVVVVWVHLRQGNNNTTN